MALGNVRLHYGHPDVFDKLATMTRGGVSKATRGLHVSEDLMGGLNHVLRGARSHFTEAISCGKGRDMGFGSILTFEAKISAGGGEASLTRDMHRFATRLDWFRFMHLFHSGQGYFITSRILSLGIYTLPLSLAMLALSGYKLSNSALQMALQIGIISALPYVCQLIVEKGLVVGFLLWLRQLIAGNIAFSIFRLQTTNISWGMDVMYGGALYMASGRGFAYGPQSFVQLFVQYSRSHLYLGFELGLLILIVGITGSAGNQYGEVFSMQTLIVFRCNLHKNVVHP